jgi:hypothetical protein
MRFAAFEKSILSSDLKAVAAHWIEARGTKRIPSWADIRPAAIVKQLPIVWSYVYDPAEDEFIGRLGGDAITRIFDKNLKGIRLSELQPVLDYKRLSARAKRVMTEPALFRGHGLVFKQLDRYGQGERIIMPLSRDGISGDAIFGATDYQVIGHLPSEAEEVAEVEDWFTLK